MARLPELIGEQDVARLLSVAPSTVRVWRLRGVLPEPDAVVNGTTHVWSRGTIRTWAEHSGRLPAGLRRQALGFIRDRIGAASLGEIEDGLGWRWARERDSGSRNLQAVLQDLRAEGLVRSPEEDLYEAVPVLDADTFEDRCLMAVYRVRKQLSGQGWVSVGRVADDLRLPEWDRGRVADALGRMCAAGLIYPAIHELPPFPSREREGLFFNLTPAGFERTGIRSENEESNPRVEIRELLESQFQNEPVRLNEFGGMTELLDFYRRQPWEPDPELAIESVGDRRPDGIERSRISLKPLGAYRIQADSDPATLKRIRENLLYLVAKVRHWDKWHE
jgi:hypothetical protein